MPVNHLRRLVFVALVWLPAFGASAQPPAEQPALLVSSADIARIQALLKGDAPGASAEQVQAARADLRALRAYFGSDLGAERLPGELLGTALLHRIDPTHPDDRARVARIEAAMKAPLDAIDDPLELALAVHCCKRSINPDAAAALLRTALPKIAMFAEGDSPSRPREFRQRLFALTLALSFDGQSSEEAGWESVRTEILEAARKYFAGTFPRYLELRGPTPTAPTHAAQEETDTFLAVELADALHDGAYWPRVAAGVSGWLTHHLFSVAPGKAFRAPLLRDAVGGAELGVLPQFRDLVPLGPHLLARRTGDPGAARIAEYVAAKLRDERAPVLARPWRWVPLALGVDEIETLDLESAPLALNLGNAVIMQGGPKGPRIWIEVGSPYLRPGQHFDAGHFLAVHEDHLIAGGGADISTQAVPLKDGEQRLGAGVAPFHFEQYRVSTIAHNCLLFWDDSQVEKWEGEPFVPVGGQRVASGVLTDFTPPPPRQADPRQRGKLTAFGVSEGAAYAALDLTAAYPKRAVARYTREFLFLSPDQLLVIDRARSARPSCTPIFIMNLPAPPLIDGEPLANVQRISGPAESGPGAAQSGIWSYADASEVRWGQGHASCRLELLLPAPGRLTIAGGPAVPQRVPEGDYRGWSYMGGSADGFERLVIPASRHRPRNAWYRLGRPSALGPAFEVVPHWGRIEFDATDRQSETVFLSLITLGLTASKADAVSANPAKVVQSAADWEVSFGSGTTTSTLRIPRSGAGGSFVGADGQAWALPTEVHANPHWNTAH